MEIHVELKTNSKMFCGCKNDPFHAPKPNIYTCPVCLGMPGAIPVPNQKAIDWTIKLGLALGSDISLVSKFDRKHYFYPDLAKGYQISQYDQPIALGGSVPILIPKDGTSPAYEKVVRIRRVHLEEDTGKLLHATVDGQKVSLIDFNRSGVPLVEIVTEPDIRTGEEARQFLKKLHQIIRYLEISDADMEKGSMRLEPNISVMRTQNSNPRTQIIEENELPPYKVEVKNINSFTFVKKAIDFETQRHIEILETDQYPVQETRGYNEDKGITVSQRRKEEANDYRYFPDPDIPPLHFTKEKLTSIAGKIPELPDEKVMRFVNDYTLESRVAEQLTENRLLADYFEDAVTAGKKDGLDGVKLANWILNKKVDKEHVKPDSLVADIVAATKTADIDPKELEKIITSVLSENPKAVEAYKAGKTQVLGFLLGMVMKKSGKKLDMSELKKALLKQL